MRTWHEMASVRGGALGLCALLAGMAVVHAGQGAAPAASTMRTAAPLDLRGVWQVVSYVRDGHPVAMDAMMIVTQDHFSRVESERNRNPLDGIDFRKIDALTPAQIRLVAEAFPRANASAGTYRIEGNTFYFTSVTHHNPGAVGHEAKRTIDLRGDRLILSGPAGSGVLAETWERVEKFR